MTSVRQFKIDVAQEKLDLLHQKLALTTFPDEIEDAGWDYGAPLADIKRLVHHWQTRYSWREHEAKLNDTLPQYTTDVEVDKFGSLNIHFVHQKSKVQGAIPLLFCHGWPGSFLEVSKLLPLLVKGGHEYPAFHIVAPSLPNFGFSEGVKKKGFMLRHYAEVCHNLMLSLGYERYVTQGGDWGFFVTRVMGLYYPKSCLASHLTMALPAFPSYDQPLLAIRSVLGLLMLSQREKDGLQRAQYTEKEGMGYFKEQSTQPQTIGYSQADSPVGLLAWIYEKLHHWTDDYAWTDDEIITWISIYVFSRAGPAAASRIYYEVDKDPEKHFQKTRGWIGGVKLGIARFPKEIGLLPKVWAGSMGNVVHTSEFNAGGHFAAYEQPELLADDLRSMFSKGGGAFGVLEEYNGYVD